MFRLLPAFVLMASLASGQSAFYGTATGHPKAGDTAPDLVFSQVLSAPVAASWSQANLTGQVTVLSFFPDTSHNPKAVADWNARVDQFARRHVQFVWITGEERGTLMPALARHPIKGWVLYDPDGSTAKAFGLDIPGNIYIGANRNIIGFEEGYVPDEPTLNAVLEGRIALTRPTPATMTSFRENNLVALDSVPARMPRAEDHRPHFAPSYAVHITPSVGNMRGNFGGGDYWVLQGLTLKEVIEELYGLNSVRVELPLSMDSAKRYDFAILLPHVEGRGEMSERFKQALQEYFHLALDREERFANVYVVSREPGRKPPIEIATDADWSRVSSVGFQAPRDSEGRAEAKISAMILKVRWIGLL
jgi:peroxiredoxin